MKKSGGSVSTIIIGPSKSVLIYALHSLENVLGLVLYIKDISKFTCYAHNFTFGARDNDFL